MSGTKRLRDGRSVGELFDENRQFGLKDVQLNKKSWWPAHCARKDADDIKQRASYPGPRKSRGQQAFCRATC